MRVLLISTYELGHQPVHLAVPAGELRARGHDVTCLDLSVDAWDPAVLDGIDRVAISVPMHTAMRLAQEILPQIHVPVALYGLYGSPPFQGEYLAPLVEWIDGAGSGALPAATGALPARDLLPPLDRYAKLAVGDDVRLAGTVEAGRGCISRCRHCPVPAVYDGRTRIVAVADVVADVAQLVALGAEHISYGDPDFLSGPAHARRVVDAVHAAFPKLTFDITTKVELALRHRDLFAAFADAGCLFVISAVECVDDNVLRILDKGHTAADASAAVTMLRRHGIEPRPSLMPFTPWTTREALVALTDWVAAHDLPGSIDPVQWSIRLLLPDGSLLLDEPTLQPHLTGYDHELLGHQWRAADPAMDVLQQRIAAIVEDGAGFDEVRALVRDEPVARGHWTATCDRPHLTESWFCCAEPTTRQHLLVAGDVLQDRVEPAELA
ncbi:MAG: hypothetical protein QOI47_2398 [Actinomycetota bacterium]|nr:hypothetical protein [Actinomycetota bacterium]